MKRNIYKAKYLCKNNCQPPNNEEYVHQQHCLRQKLTTQLAEDKWWSLKINIFNTSTALLDIRGVKEELTGLLPARSPNFPLAIAPNILPNVNIEPKTEYWKSGRCKLINFSYGLWTLWQSLSSVTNLFKSIRYGQANGIKKKIKVNATRKYAIPVDGSHFEIRKQVKTLLMSKSFNFIIKIENSLYLSLRNLTLSRAINFCLDLSSSASIDSIQNNDRIW